MPGLLEIALLVGGGFAAGVVNTLAGGGSLLTVPMLIYLGLPATVANGTNRVGVLAQNLTSAWRFRSEGVDGLRSALPALVPVGVGSILGAYAVAQLTPESFERLFGIIMVLLLVPMVRGWIGAKPDVTERATWSRGTTLALFFAIGVYGGAIQAGVGIVLLFALSHSGYDLVRANSIKVVVIASLTVVAVPVFALEGQIAWVQAGFLTIGFAAGGAAGVRVAIIGGERVIRPVLVAAVLALAGRMLGLY